MVQPDRPQMTIWRMRFACWIIKTTDPHSEYVIPIAFLLQQCFTNVPHCYVTSTLTVLLLI